MASVVSAASPAFGLTQDEITAQALNVFNSKASTFPANTNYYLNQYMNGIPPTYPQYEGTLLTWGETYLGMANRVMFRATRDTQYLENILDHAELMYAHRADRVSPPIYDEIRNRQMPAFVSFGKIYAPNDRQHSALIVSSYHSNPVAAVMADIKRDPQLNAEYGTRADSLIADVTETMDSFDGDFSMLSGGRGRYSDPYFDILFPSTNGDLPYNMQSGTGQTYIGLWKSTGDQRFYDRAAALAKTLKAELTPVSDRYTWRYAPSDSSGSASDVSHAAMDVSFIVDAYEAGIVFDDTDIQRLVNTFRYIRRNTAVTDYVNGSGAATFDNIRHVTNWLPLVRYDASLRQEMLPVFQSYWNTDCCTFPMLGAAYFYESGQYYAQEHTFQESFDDLQLSPRWRRPSAQSLSNSWTAQTTGSQLVVSDIKTSTNEAWVDVLRTRDVDLNGSWEVAFDFSWDSVQAGTDPLQAMQRFFVDLRDEHNALIGQVGISDAWNDHNGGRVIKLFNQSIVEPLDSLGPSGTASIRILSDAMARVSQVYWNDVPMLSVPNVANLGQVGMRFGHLRHFSGGQLRSHFGSVSVGSLAVTGDTNRPPGSGDVIFDGFDDGNRAKTPNGINWYTFSQPSSSLPLTIVDDSANLGSGNALKADMKTTQQVMMGVFDTPVSLPATIGAKLTLRFEMRNDYAGGSVPGTVRFGMYDADEASFPNPAGFGGQDGNWWGQQPGSRNDPGFYIQQDNFPAPAGATAVRVREESNQVGGGFSFGLDDRQIAAPPDGTFIGLDQTNGKNIFTVELERLAPGIGAGAWRYTYTLDNGTTSATLTGLHRAAADFDVYAGAGNGITATGTFDYFAFFYEGVSGGLADFLIDNFSISIAEPELPGDYNRDGSVDAADYVVWRDNMDTYGGPAGYETWRANFGRTAGADTAASVPEPASILLVLALAVPVLARCRSGHHEP